MFVLKRLHCNPAGISRASRWPLALVASNVPNVCSPRATASEQHYVGRQLAISLASNIDWVGCQHLLDAAR